MVDKDYCASSYLALRYIERDGMNFFEGLDHKNAQIVSADDRIGVYTAEDIDRELQKSFAQLEGRHLGIMLSGGIDSANLASYMPGSDAYTFRFLGGKFQADELKRAETYARRYNLKLHYVDIDWENTVEKYLPICFEANQAPVHSIVPQIYQAAKQAQADGVDCLVLGECADSTFGGLDKMLSHEWGYDEFIDWFQFVKPEHVLKNTYDMTYVFEPFKRGDKIDYIAFMKTIFAQESETSYINIFTAAEMAYSYPYQNLTLAEGYDLDRIRSGDTKYLLRDLFRMKYPGLPVPEKNPMPRPVDEYFKAWEGPTRPEFLDKLDMTQFSGNQKWQIWCLETFYNMYDPL